MKATVTALMAAFTLMTSTISAESFYHGKADAGVAVLTAKITESGKTVKRCHMTGFSANGTVVLENGIAFKPTLLAASGEGSLFNGGLGVGFLLPLCEGFYVTPQVALTYGSLEAMVPFYGKEEKERFYSWTPAIGFDVSYMINECWGVGVAYLYGWSKTHTDIGSIVSQTTHSEGGNYKAQIDYYITHCWSVNLAFAYNTSMSKEKHGLSAAGGRLGVGYCF